MSHRGRIPARAIDGTRPHPLRGGRRGYAAKCPTPARGPGFETPPPTSLTTFHRMRLSAHMARVGHGRGVAANLRWGRQHQHQHWRRQMTGLATKSFDDPDETRPFADKGMALVVDVGGGVVLKGQFEPGWRWSEHLGPVVGTDSCQSPPPPLRALGADASADERRERRRVRTKRGGPHRTRT